MSAAAAASRPSPIAAGRLPRAALIAAVAAALANVVVYFITIALGVDMSGPFMGPDSPPVALSVVLVIIASAVPVIGAAILLWLLARFTARALTIFTAIAVVFGLLSLGRPLTLPVSQGLQMSLALMHVVAGGIITAVLVTQARRS